MTSRSLFFHILSLILLSGSVAVSPQHEADLAEATAPGTTLHLEDIFRGRCLEYQEVVNPSAFTQGKKNCTELWELFSGAFMYKDPCNISLESYQPLADASFHRVPENSMILWEGVYPFVEKYADSGKRHFSLGYTLAGYLMDSLYWCGQLDPPGINYEECVDSTSCELVADMSFWKRISQTFSQNAEGVVTVMLNASLETAFDPASILAMFELPELDPDKVSKVITYLVRDIDVAHKESCGAGTLLDLKDLIENQVGIEFECIDDPASPRLLLCVDHPDSDQCSTTSSAYSILQNLSVQLAVFLVYIS